MISLDPIHEFAPGTVCEVLRPRQVPVVGAHCADVAHAFDAVTDIDGVTVSLYPPDLVIMVRMLDARCALIRYAGSTLAVIAAKHLKRSEVRLS